MLLGRMGAQRWTLLPLRTGACCSSTARNCAGNYRPLFNPWSRHRARSLQLIVRLLTSGALDNYKCIIALFPRLYTIVTATTYAFQPVASIRTFFLHPDPLDTSSNYGLERHPTQEGTRKCNTFTTPSPHARLPDNIADLRGIQRHGVHSMDRPPDSTR